MLIRLRKQKNTQFLKIPRFRGTVNVYSAKIFPTVSSGFQILESETCFGQFKRNLKVWVKDKLDN